MAKTSAIAKAFAGRWRIVEMDTGTMTSSISSHKHISPFRAGRPARLPSVR